MRKRDFFRHVPGISTLVKAVEHYESSTVSLAAANQHLAAENQRLAAEIQQLAPVNQKLGIANRQLTTYLSQLLFAGDTPLTESRVPEELRGDGLPIPAAVLRFLVAG